MQKARISSVGTYLPSRVVTNSEMSQWMDTSDSWIRERSGIQERRFAAADESTSDLATKAAEACLKRANVAPAEVDFIVAATLSPDFYFPGISTMIQTKLGLNQVPSLDIRAQCSGFVYGVSLCNALIANGTASKILLVCAEVQSKLINLSTSGRDMAVLFGDGAGAVLVEKAMPNDKSIIIDSVLGSDGSGSEILSLKKPGTTSERFLTEADIQNKSIYPNMDGKTVFKHAISRMVEAVEKLLERNSLQLEDIDLVIPHQANIRISEMVREKLQLPPEKVFNNIHKYGNTTAATIPLCLKEAEDLNILKKGSKIITVAFGAGFTWGANLIIW